MLPAHPIKFWGLRYQPQPASSGERAIPQRPFWDPWHRDQQGHYLCSMRLSGFFPDQWALRQDCVPGSLNPHTGYPGTWGMLGAGHEAKRSWWPLWEVKGRKQGPLESSSFRGSGLHRDLN
uniref:Uncharacterized protein n=1 Tax=Myotis myotis TaxID=51298 RepID=A0A7J7XZX3_MYOMY|nr:hypothetical protein mMyoMyo1_011455 [Myotis myotis]